MHEILDLDNGDIILGNGEIDMLASDSYQSAADTVFVRLARIRERRRDVDFAVAVGVMQDYRAAFCLPPVEFILIADSLKAHCMDLILEV